MFSKRSTAALFPVTGFNRGIFGTRLTTFAIHRHRHLGGAQWQTGPITGSSETRPNFRNTQAAAKLNVKANLRDRALFDCVIPAKCFHEKNSIELSLHWLFPSRSLRISDRMYSLKLMESELAFRFASRCNAAGNVIAI